MADNVDAPVGFNPTVVLRATPYDTSTAATAIFIGDIVEVATDGYLIPATGADTALYGSAGDYSAASTQTLDVAVFDHPDQMFTAQDDASATTDIAYGGSNNDFIAGAGSTTTLLSGHEIAVSTVTAATANIRMIHLVNRPDNAYGANSEWVVQINEHAYKSTTGI